MVTIIILIVILILSLLIVPFLRQLVIDKEELSQNPINKKFQILVDIINEHMLSGQGHVVLFDKDPKSMNLFSDNQQNVIFQFFYGTGNLTITMKYKYYHKELKHTKTFYNLRNVSLFQQKDIANAFIEECQEKIIEHRQMVSGEGVNSQTNTPPPSSDADPTSVISSLFSNLSEEQKCSMVNLLYVTGITAHFPEADILSTSVMKELQIYLGIDWTLCCRHFSEGGESKIVKDLTNLEESVFLSYMLFSFQYINELKMVSISGAEMAAEKLSAMFELIGYDEDALEKMMAKLQAFNNYFNIK